MRAGLAHARQNGQRLGRPATAALHAAAVRKLYRTGVSEVRNRPPPADRADFGAPYLNIEESINMPAKKSAVPSDIYQLKLTLLGTRPPIWRRLLVPADLTLAQLHDVLQAAMGWEDGHMHEFSIGPRRFGRPNPEDRLMGMPSVENERTMRLSAILGRVGSKAIYTDDFGDSWEHSIVLEKRLSVDPNR